MTRSTHPPTRAEALARLSDFVPRAGRDYAGKRNHDLPGHPHVSVLSPYIRHRLVTEEEVLQAVLGRFALSSAEKFVQEVFWRTYWKGWLEMRPSVWPDYQRGVSGAVDRVQTEAGLRGDWEAACQGETGIEAFDHWARELVETGYMHNHARMWFASIWIFTLRLPWELGADFFLRHLLDGDPASNTLSWRWVAGLQTRGKNYVARASNISKYTDGARQVGYALDTSPAPLDGPPHPPRMDPPTGDWMEPGRKTGLLLTEEDLSPGFLLDAIAPEATFVLTGTPGRSPLMVSDAVSAFTEGAIADCLARFGGRLGDVAGPSTDFAEAEAWARKGGFEQIVVPYAPVGPASEAVSALTRALVGDIPVRRVMRPYDAMCWPFATAGFFKFKEKIPRLIGDLKGLRAA
ncbi:MAG: FAD-binding domain-containing protein [Pseudomonadota bacterium]